LDETDYINGFLDFAAFTRGEEQLHTRPWILNWSGEALRLLSRQRETRPLTDALWALRPGHLRFVELLQGCWDIDLKWEFAEMAKSREKRTEVRSAELFLKQLLSNPLIRLREGLFDPRDHFRNGGIVIVDGRNIEHEVRRVAIGCRNLSVLHAVARGI
jgi:hypothetical protein